MGALSLILWLKATFIRVRTEPGGTCEGKDLMFYLLAPFKWQINLPRY